jgi:ABC-type lipoprotein export system ATPase subunit
MSGVLKNSIVVLVTHHLQYAQLADAMLVVGKYNLTYPNPCGQPI